MKDSEQGRVSRMTAFLPLSFPLFLLPSGEQDEGRGCQGPGGAGKGGEGAGGAGEEAGQGRYPGQAAYAAEQVGGLSSPPFSPPPPPPLLDPRLAIQRTSDSVKQLMFERDLELEMLRRKKHY